MAKAKQGFFLLYCNYINPVMELADDQAGRLFKAILCHVNGLPMPEMKSPERIAFSFMQAQLDASRERYEAKCETNRANGVKGGRPPKQVDKAASPAQDETQKNRSVISETDVNPLDIKKPEKPEKKHFAEFVTMTEAEHEKLVQKYGEEATARMIEILDNYKGSSTKNAKRYTSDYRAILSWVAGRYEEEQARHPKTVRTQTQVQDTDDDWARFYQEGYNR